jgi:hypothetical protein
VITPWSRVGEWRYSSTRSLTSALEGGEWSASRPCRFTSRERSLGTHWTGGCVGPRSVLDAMVKREIPNLRRELNPRTPTDQPVAQRYTGWAITARIFPERFSNMSNCAELCSWHLFPTTFVMWKHFCGFSFFVRDLCHVSRIIWFFFSVREFVPCKYLRTRYSVEYLFEFFICNSCL